MIGFYQFLSFLYFQVDGAFVAVRSIIFPNVYDNIIELLIRYDIRWNIRSSVVAPGRKRNFTFLFVDSLAPLNPVIMESPTINVVPFFHSPGD